MCASSFWAMAIISSAGDPKGNGLGWPRNFKNTKLRFRASTSSHLPAPDETTSMLAERWQSEVQRRFSAETENKLVIALSNQRSCRRNFNFKKPTKHRNHR